MLPRREHAEVPIPPAHSLQAFATSVQVVDDLLPEPDRLALRDALLHEASSGPGFEVSQVGGWHSVPDLAQRPDPRFRRLIDGIVQAVASRFRGEVSDRGLALPRHQWKVEAWAVVLQHGGYHRVHDHPGSHYAVAYYVDAGDAPGSGVLTLLDPSRARPPIAGLPLWPTDLDLQPQTGSLTLFPAHVQHYVHPYRGTRPRICVSANLTVALTAPDRD